MEGCRASPPAGSSTTDIETAPSGPAQCVETRSRFELDRTGICCAEAGAGAVAVSPPALGGSNLTGDSSKTEIGCACRIKAPSALPNDPCDSCDSCETETLVSEDPNGLRREWAATDQAGDWAPSNTHARG